jgi:hypothetical protein
MSQQWYIKARGPEAKEKLELINVPLMALLDLRTMDWPAM